MIITCYFALAGTLFWSPSKNAKSLKYFIWLCMIKVKTGQVKVVIAVITVLSIETNGWSPKIYDYRVCVSICLCSQMKWRGVHIVYGCCPPLVPYVCAHACAPLPVPL